MRFLKVYFLIFILISKFSNIIFSQNINEISNNNTNQINVDDILGFNDNLCSYDKENFVNKHVILKLSKNKYLELLFSSEKDKMNYLDKCLVILFRDNKRYIIKHSEFLNSILTSFRDSFKQVLEGERKLDESINNDIGFLRNELFIKKNLKSNLTYR